MVPTKRLVLTIGLAISLGGCSASIAATLGLEPTTETIAHTQKYTAYGGAGLLTDAEGATLRGLAWPQVYADMIGTFGYPNVRNQDADIYLVNGSEYWVFYEGTTATGLEVK